MAAATNFNADNGDLILVNNIAKITVTGRTLNIFTNDGNVSAILYDTVEMALAKQAVYQTMIIGSSVPTLTGISQAGTVAGGDVVLTFSGTNFTSFGGEYLATDPSFGWSYTGIFGATNSPPSVVTTSTSIVIDLTGAPIITGPFSFTYQNSFGITASQSITIS